MARRKYRCTEKVAVGGNLVVRLVLITPAVDPEDTEAATLNAGMGRSAMNRLYDDPADVEAAEFVVGQSVYVDHAFV